MLTAFYREFEGYLRTFGLVLKNIDALRLPPVRDVFNRQIYFTGVRAASEMVVRAAFIGTIIVAFTVDVLDADADLAVKILLWIVLREVGPLVTAVLVILRSGTAVSSELALMKVTGEITSLELMGINPYNYLVVPRVVGIGLSTVVLTFIFQIIAVGGGLLLSPLVIDVTFKHLITGFFRLVSVWDLVYSVIKSLFFGLIISVVCSYHGLHPSGTSINAIPPAVTKAVTQCAIYILLFNAVFAYFVFGVFLFGLVTTAN